MALLSLLYTEFLHGHLFGSSLSSYLLHVMVAPNRHTYKMNTCDIWDYCTELQLSLHNNTVIVLLKKHYNSPLGWMTDMLRV